jgi:hypothetical protein
VLLCLGDAIGKQALISIKPVLEGICGISKVGINIVEEVILIGREE